MSKVLKIKNWKKFQHFKDRRPPWIKLYRELLDDPEWHILDGESAKILMMLWLLASEDKSKEGYLPDIKMISFRLRISQDKIEMALPKLNHWVTEHDIKTISGGYQDDAPETETEGEGEGETETEAGTLSLKKRIYLLKPDYFTTGQWNELYDHRTRLKATQTERAYRLLIKEFDKAINHSLTANDILNHMSSGKGWAGFKYSWVVNKKKNNDPMDLLEAGLL